MAYTNIDDPSAYFQTAIYTGNGGSGRAIVNDGNSAMQPDWVWYKSRSNATSNILYDSSRGADYYLKSNTSGAEGSDANMFESFDSDGFSLNGDTDGNGSGRTYVAWQWKANGGTTASNSDGTITSTTQVNSDAGFSIQTLTSASSGTSNWGHGLGQKPDWWVVKITGSGGGGWWLHHKGLNSGASSQYLGLNSTAAATNLSAFDASSSTITASADFVANSKTMVCYAFIEKQGYSKFGSYVGNLNLDGPYVYTGFKPAWIMVKRAVGGTSSYSGWGIHDSKRYPFNNNLGGTKVLWAHDTHVEGTRGQGSSNSGGTGNIDILSNGFKIRDNGSDEFNDPDDTYIYMAFAENPFVTSTGVPTTAR